MIGKVEIATHIDVTTAEYLDNFCARIHRTRAAVLRGLLYALLIDGEQFIFDDWREQVKHGAYARPKMETAAMHSVRNGGRANADGMDDAARAFIKSKPDLTVKELIAGLAGLGIERKKTWVTEARLAVRGSGSKRAE